MRSRSIILGAILLPAASLQADDLGLVNGHSLQDKTVAQTDSHLIWLSDNFGELTFFHLSLCQRQRRARGLTHWNCR